MTLYGPNNPHPLSRMKTELVWEGKYDEFGTRRELAFAGGDHAASKDRNDR
jgi:adenine-specific DNA-methyltransferase